MKELTLEEYIKEIDSYFKALRKVPRSIHTLIAAGQCIQRDSEDQGVRTQVFQINEALKHFENTALREMVNISESLRALERIQHEPPVDKGDTEIDAPDIDLPKV